MKPGKELERLVDTLERAIVGKEEARVVSPYKVVDRTTARIREHDVAVIISIEHHEMVTPIECRDRSAFRKWKVFIKSARTPESIEA